MEQAVKQMPLELSKDALSSLENIRALALNVHSSEQNKVNFAEQVEQEAEKSSKKANLAAGIGYFILGKDKPAIEKLEKADNSAEKFLYLSFAQRRLRQYDNAIKSLDKSLKHDTDSLTVSLEKARTYREKGDYEAAEKEFANCANFENVSAEYHYQRGRLREVQGRYDEAVREYQKALELLPEHRNALFHLAYRCDLAGEEDAAIDYYRQLASMTPVSVSALLNLAVIYEDKNRFEKAARCVNKVLSHHPNHRRAILFKKDIESSKTMYYDEEKERRKDRKNQILETPITDFELSVRSRNCLKKMNITTLEDLLEITESELLSYKNFGETSLKEIKAILETKGLRLGMKREDTQFAGSDEQQTHIDAENQALLEKPIEDINLSIRAHKCLESLNIKKVGQLTSTTEAELLGCKNFGVTSLNEIKQALGDIGLSLRTLE